MPKERTEKNLTGDRYYEHLDKKYGDFDTFEDGNI